MYITIDTSALIAVIGNEPPKWAIVDVTTGCSLYAPTSVHWEIGNAFSAMFKKGALDIASAKLALEAYEEISIRFIDISLEHSLELSSALGIYAYDAYLLQCAREMSAPLLTLDKSLQHHARTLGVQLLELDDERI